jgi:hypothetical protein
LAVDRSFLIGDRRSVRTAWFATRTPKLRLRLRLELMLELMLGLTHAGSVGVRREGE